MKNYEKKLKRNIGSRVKPSRCVVQSKIKLSFVRYKLKTLKSHRGLQATVHGGLHAFRSISTRTLNVKVIKEVV